MATTTTPGSGVVQHGSVPFPHLRTAHPRAPAVRPSPPVAPLTRRAVLPYLLSSPSPSSSSRPRFAPPGIARVAASRVTSPSSCPSPSSALGFAARPPPSARVACVSREPWQDRARRCSAVRRATGPSPERRLACSARAGSLCRGSHACCGSLAPPPRARERRESSDAAQTSAPPPLPPAAARRPMPPVAAAPGSVGDGSLLLLIGPRQFVVVAS